MEILEALRFRQSWKIGLRGRREAEFHLQRGQSIFYGMENLF